MEPGHEDREYLGLLPQRVGRLRASMEPGHEDREYLDATHGLTSPGRPQWSPVMKTGNTHREGARPAGCTSLNGARS